MLTQPKNKGEYYLTDAFQYMIDKGAKIQVDRRRRLVRRGQDRHAARDQPRDAREGARAAPADVDRRRDDHRSRLHRGRRHASTDSTIGPNVSIGAGSIIEDSELRDAVDRRQDARRAVASSRNSTHRRREVALEGVKGEMTIGDHSEVHVSE